MRRSYSIAVLTLFLLAPPLAAQQPSVTDRLAGDTYRVWIVTAIDQTLGSDKKCTEGREFEFNKDGSVTERVCKDGAIQETRSNWTHENDGIDDFISIGDIKYRLIISTQKDTENDIEYEEAVLRHEGEKTDPTLDIILRRIP